MDRLRAPLSARRWIWVTVASACILCPKGVPLVSLFCPLLRLSLLALGLLLLLCILSGCDYSDEEKAEGKHCHTWTYDFKDTIKEQLNDPDSFKACRDTLRIGPAYDVGSGGGKYAGWLLHNVEMEFGARNAMGGMVRATAYGLMSNEDCRASVTGITRH